MRPLALAALLALGAAACGRSRSGVQGLRLPTLDGAKTVDLSACPTPTCLAVYVAPWCPYCRAAMPLIKELRALLRAHGMESWVIVGLDREAAVRDYARNYGGDTLVDMGHALDPGGVPHFYVVDDRGRVLRQIAGLPPDPRRLLAWIVQGEK